MARRIRYANPHATLQSRCPLPHTQDEDFLFGESVASIVVVSRVRQARRLTERIEVWRRAVGELLSTPQSLRLFELTDEGVLMPWRDATQKGEGADG